MPGKVLCRRYVGHPSDLETRGEAQEDDCARYQYHEFLTVVDNGLTVSLPIRIVVSGTVHDSAVASLALELRTLAHQCRAVVGPLVFCHSGSRQILPNGGDASAHMPGARVPVPVVSRQLLLGSALLVVEG